MAIPRTIQQILDAFDQGDVPQELDFHESWQSFLHLSENNTMTGAQVWQGNHRFDDSVLLNFGSGSDVSLSFDGTNLVFNQVVAGNVLFQVPVHIRGTGAATRPLQFYDNDNTHYVSLQAPGTVAASLAFVLPTTDGSAGQGLVTDGALALGWADVTGEINTNSNTVGGAGLVNAKSGFDTPIRSLASANDRLSIAQDGGGLLMNFTINEANFDLNLLGGTLGIDQTDATPGTGISITGSTFAVDTTDALTWTAALTMGTTNKIQFTDTNHFIHHNASNLIVSTTNEVQVEAVLAVNDSTNSQLKLYEAGNYTALKVGSLTTDATIVLPTNNAPTDGHVLKVNGTPVGGVITTAWQAESGVGGGEANEGENIGDAASAGSVGEVYKQMNGDFLQFRRVKAMSTKLTVDSSLDDNLQMDVDPGKINLTDLNGVTTTGTGAVVLAAAPNLTGIIDIAGSLDVDGSADAIQLLVEGHTSQTAAVMKVQTTGGATSLFEIAVGGDITMKALATIDGMDPSVAQTKLDGIEALADVTNDTNLQAAGSTAVFDADFGSNGILTRTAAGDYTQSGKSIADAGNSYFTIGNADGASAGNITIDLNVLNVTDLTDVAANGGVSINDTLVLAAKGVTLDVVSETGTMRVADNVLSKTITIEDPLSAENIAIWYTPVAITVTAVRGVVVGSSPTTNWTLKDDTARNGAGNTIAIASAFTSETGAAVSITDGTVPSGSWVWVEMGAQTNVDQVTLTFFYTIFA